MFNNLKTSTQIGLKFTIYTIVQIIIFAIFANIVFFFKWYNMENDRINWRTNFQLKIEKRQENNQNWVQDKQPLPEYFPRRIQLFDENSELWNQIVDNRIFNNISKIDSNYYMFIKTSWRIHVTDISPHISMQINLIYISIILLILLSALAYIFSTSFVKSSLNKLNKLNQFLENLDIDSLNKKIDIRWHKDDEINKLSNKFNKVLDKLNKQTIWLKDFIKNASHEIKTPLMVINSEVDYAIKSKDYENSLSNVKNQIKSLWKLLDMLIEITKYETTDNITIWEIDVVKDTNIIIKNLQTIYQEKQISINLVAKGQCVVKWYSTSWLIICKNLIDNSYKYSQNWSKINIYISENKFIIKDEWIWICKENLEHIWDRFWQWDSSNSDINSYWLWLHIVKLLIEKNKWKIEVESNEWKWTTFTIYFQ